MTRQVFISSVQKEFAAERRALRDFIAGDALLRRFFHVFLFEDLPAKDRRADRAYLAEIAPSDIVLFLFGSEYGPPPGAAGLSPTEREFDRASDTNRPRLVFLKSDVGPRDARMQRLIARAEATLIRRRFASQPELTAYEIPPEVIREAIVNAVAHRDYTSDGSVQVMLFADRLEIWNPGSLPPSLTLAMLRKPHGSFPRNPLLAEPLYLAKYIERMGTGTGDMIARCKKAGLSAPRFTVTDGFKVTIPRPPGAQRMASGAGGIRAATPQGPRKDPAGTPQVVAVLSAATNPQSRAQLQAAAGLVDREHFRRDYLEVLLSSGLLERTIPDKPTSSRQRYRLTKAGKAFLLKQAKRGQR